MATDEAAANANPRAYIFGVAKRLRYEHRRRINREQQLDSAAGQQRSLIDEAARTEARLILKAALKRLLPWERRLILRYLTERDHATLARELGMKPATLRVAAHRIRRKLRAMIDPPPHKT